MQKLPKHQSLSMENNIRPNDFTPITSGMSREEIYGFFLIRNITILKFPIWAIRKISNSQIVQSLKLSMLQWILRQVPRGTIETLNHIKCKGNHFLRSHTHQTENSFGKGPMIILGIYSLP